MFKYKHSMFLLLSTTIVTSIATNANAANWRLTPSIAVTETYSDNIDLDVSAQQSDFVTQVTPTISLVGSGARLNTSIQYGANYFYYPGDDDEHDLRHNLNATINSELINDTFFVESNANISQQFVDRRQAISVQDVTRTDNRRTVQTYQISPYLVHRFGSWATAQLRYNLSHVRSSSDTLQTTPDTVFGKSLSHQGTLSVSSGSSFSKLGWTFMAQTGIEERENFADYENTVIRGDMSYRLTRYFSALGSIGYQKRQTVGSFSNYDGFIWDIGFRLVPGPRTSLSFRYGNQNDGDTYSLDAQYKITAKNSINLSYTDTIQTFQSLAFDNNNPDLADPLFNNNFVSGDITRRKQWLLALSGVRGRTSYSVSARYSHYRSDNTSLNEKRYSAGASLERRLNSRLSVSASFSYNLSQFLSDNRDDTFWSASTNMNYQISKSLTGTLSYVHSDRNQALTEVLNGGSNYISLSIRAAI